MDIGKNDDRKMLEFCSHLALKNRGLISLALVPFLVVGQVQCNKMYVSVCKVIINAISFFTKKTEFELAFIAK